MGGIGDRFFAGDATPRAKYAWLTVPLGYSWILGATARTLNAARRSTPCCSRPPFSHLNGNSDNPAGSARSARIEARRAEVNASRVDSLPWFAEITYDLITRFSGCAGCPTQFSSPAESDERAGGDCLLQQLQHGWQPLNVASTSLLLTLPIAKPRSGSPAPCVTIWWDRSALSYRRAAGGPAAAGGLCRRQ